MKRRYWTHWLTLGLVLAGPAVRLHGGTAPFIITAPASQTNDTGASVSFAVAAGGDAPLIYAWYAGTNALTDDGNVSGSATPNLTLASLATTDAGTYSVVISNASGTISTGAVLTVYTRLVQNGGFETGDTSSWTPSAEILLGLNAVVFPFAAHSGNYGFAIGVPEVPGYLSQALPTCPGQPYLISVWLNSDGGITNEFIVSWDGTNIYDQVNLPAQGWVNLQITAAASSTNCVLGLGARDDAGFFSIDDVSVAPVPVFLTVTNAAGILTGTFNRLAGFRYQVQSCAELAADNWTNWGNVCFAETNATGSFSVPAAAPQQFFRLELVP